MLSLYVKVQSLLADRRGVTAIEYAVMAGAVAVALVAIMGNQDHGVMQVLKNKLSTIINSIPSN